jgi:ATP-dependent helicase/nuclease subunit B
MEELDLFSARRVTCLGWDRPMLDLVVEWLTARKDELPGMVVVMPTAQGGRRLREALAEAGGCLAPRVVRPEWFLPKDEKLTSGGSGAKGLVAGRVSELAAWMEVLEGVEDWGEYEGVFPIAPGTGESAGWSMGLAKSLADLRRALLDAGMNLSEAARRMKGSEDGARWEALGSLEGRVDTRLRDWGLVPRARLVLGGKRELPEAVERIVLAGVADLAPVVEGVIAGAGRPVDVLVGAPEEKGFDAWGRADPEWWADQRIDMGEEAIHVCADAGHEAIVAREYVAREQTTSGDLALGTADPGVVPELRREFGKVGWELYDPAGRSLRDGGMMDWLGRWREFLGSGEIRHLASLVTGASAGRIMRVSRFQLSQALSLVRSELMPQRIDDLRRLAGAEWLEEAGKWEAALLVKVRKVLDEIRPLLDWRERFRNEDFCGLLGEFLAVIGPKPGEDAEADELRMAGEEFLAEVDGFREVIDRRGPGFGFSLFGQLVAGRRLGGEEGDTVLDVQGWIEMVFDPAAHVVVCGMNEGCVPERLGGDPWLNENVREYLGMETEARREARDSWLLKNLTESRKAGGRVDLICGRVSATGEGMLPSRLLMRCGADALAERVLHVFRTPETPGAGIPWERDWTLELDPWKPVEKMSVTSFGSYLSCPFRFYLQKQVRMDHPEADRAEWNAREYGTIAHAVLELFGLDEEAREMSKSEAIATWFHDCLQKVVEERHGKRPPLAVQVQAESLRQRLGYLARVQACQRAAGWQIVEVEKQFEMELGGIVVTGMIDRIERHEKEGWRVSDYKTGGDHVRKAHVTELRANTRVPAHLADESAARVVLPKMFRGKLGKPGDFLWKNLQVPLYALAWREECGELPQAGYFTVWKSAAEVAYDGWQGFDAGVVEAARECAEMVIRKVRAEEFWPPSEKAKYDEQFQELAMRRPLIDSFGSVESGPPTRSGDPKQRVANPLSPSGNGGRDA